MGALPGCAKSAVKASLTVFSPSAEREPVMATRARQQRETPEYVGMLRRMIRGLGRRLAEHANPSDLADAVQLQRELDATIRQAVQAMRAEHGYSWQQLADELGCTKQAAQQRYGKPVA